MWMSLVSRCAVVLSLTPPAGYLQPRGAVDPVTIPPLACAALPQTLEDLVARPLPVLAESKPFAPAERFHLTQIQQLRTELNNSPLAGTLLEEENGFGEVLFELVREEPEVAHQISFSSPAMPLSESVPPHDESLVPLLRRTGRALDERANDLEEERQFTHADRLRQLSDQVRQIARQMEQMP